MSIPTFEFLQRDAAKLDQPKKFTDALIASGKFYRDERGLIKLKIGDGDYAVIDSRRTFREILVSGECIQLSGDLDATAFDTLWLWFGARRWAFPRLNASLPWNPPKPLPVRSVSVRR